MTNRYVAKDGERLDQIIYGYYGTVSVLHTVMMANKDLLGKAVLSAGDIVHLPDINIKPKVTEQKALWN